MQTFTMQFPVTSTVTVGNGGVITITPFGYVSTTNVDVCSVNATPMSPPAEPVQAVASFQQPPNVRVHGGVGGLMGSQQVPVTETPLFMGGRVAGYTPEYKTIQEYVSSLPTGTVIDTDRFNARNIHFGVKALWGSTKLMLTVDGVLMNPKGNEDMSARIAVLRYIAEDGTLYVAFHPGVSTKSRKIITSEFKSGNVLSHVLATTLLSAGRTVK